MGEHHEDLVKEFAKVGLVLEDLGQSQSEPLIVALFQHAQVIVTLRVQLRNQGIGGGPHKVNGILTTIVSRLPCECHHGGCSTNSRLEKGKRTQSFREEGGALPNIACLSSS